MVIELADKYGKQIKALVDVEFDAELNSNDRDFELVADISDKDITHGCRIFVPDTEIGGIIGELRSNSASDSAVWKGYTWRGLLAKKILVPPSGQDYLTVSGDVNTILYDLVEREFSGLFRASRNMAGIEVRDFKFDRFCTLLDGITAMLKSVGYRLSIRYDQGQPNGSGFVEVSASPIIDRSEYIELSQDSRLNFKVTEKTNGINHLVVGGKGELQNRTILHLYEQADGSIGKTQHYFGEDERTAFYENTSSDTADLEKQAIKQFGKMQSKTTIEMDVEKLGIDVGIGDVIGGRDYRTGTYVKKPLSDIVVQIKRGNVKKIYK